MKLERLFLPLFFLIGFSAKNVQMKGEERTFFTKVNHVFSALEKAVLFYEQNGDTLNLDAYFGLRIAQGL